MCASGLPLTSQALPSLLVEVEGRRCRALADTGCTQSMVVADLVEGATGSKEVMTVDGRVISGVREAKVNLVLGRQSMVVCCLVMPKLVKDFKMILGMDVIAKVGITVDGEGVKLREPEVAAASTEVVEITEKDFEARFDGEKWTVAWKWKDKPPVLTNQTAKYAMTEEVEKRFDEELEKWVQEGWLLPCEPPSQGVIPLMAVEQESKGKVRPVMDFRELNQYVESYTGDSDACDETLRKWRTSDGDPGILDLRNAYLQLHVREDLWQYQTVLHKGKYYVLTRLGFGLNCAPKIMSCILGKVLSLDLEIDCATDHYIDDIFVNVKKISLEQVTQHLRNYGLQTKPSERFEDARVLGLQLQRVPGYGLCWSRGNQLPDVNGQQLTRRELFSICGKLVGHYPIAGWLRVACSFIKRHCEGVSWDDQVGDTVLGWLKEVLGRLKQRDPVQGVWKVTADAGNVWCDASSLALGVLVEADDKVLEDASWLRKKEDGQHINVAELDAILKGLNLALKWGMKKIQLITDSATVYAWLQSLLTGSHRIRTSGIAEMLVRRRLAIIAELRQEYGLDLTTQLVRSEKNKADELTRVPQAWLKAPTMETSLEVLHQQHHFGVRRTLYFAQQVNPNVTREQVEEVVRACPDCASVDPAPVRWESGDLKVEENWKRLAVDVTHYNNDRFLTIVDCGPSRFAIWRKISSEDAPVVTAVLEQVFSERGPPNELLLDNSTTFRSQQMDNLCRRWGVFRGFRCAHRPSGNGIVERNHRTIKALATRSGKSPLDVLFWYNLAPLDDATGTVPAHALHSYAWRNPNVKSTPERLNGENKYSVGDVVFVKPAQSRCTTRWAQGVVTAVPSQTNVEINGTPRHVADCRPAPAGEETEIDDAVEEDEFALPRRSARITSQPARYPDPE